MNTLKACDQYKRYPDAIQRFRDDQLSRFNDYVEEQRRCNTKYYNLLCKLKIDFITFSLYLGVKKKGKQDEAQLLPLRNALTNRSMSTPRHRRNDLYSYGEWDAYRFQYGTTIYDLYIAQAKWEAYKPYLVTIHDPTPEVLIFLEQYLNSVTHYHVKNIEFTYDFYSEDNDDTVYKFIKQHTIVKWRGKGFDSEYESTFYGNNIRFASGKGLRSYHKAEDTIENKQEFIRLEMLLKRGILKKNGINTIRDVFEMDSRLVNTYFIFKYFNFKKLAKRMLEDDTWKNRVDEIHHKIQSEIENGYLFEMNQYSREYSKKYPNDTYLNDCKYMEHFISRFGYSSFLNGDSFLLSSELMEDEL